VEHQFGQAIAEFAAVEKSALAKGNSHQTMLVEVVKA